MKLKNYTVLSLLATALLANCSKGGDEVNNPLPDYDQSTSVDLPVEPLNIELDADTQLEDDVPAELRNLNYKVGAKGTQRDVLEEKPLHSLCVIANEAGTTRYYVNLEWKKTPGKTHFYIKQLDVKQVGNNKSIPKLDIAQKWYIKGFLTYNKANLNLNATAPSINYAPNGTSGINLKALTQGGSEKQAMDIPLYFDWTPLTVEPKLKGTDAVATSTEKQRPINKRIVIKPFGTMLRISIANKEDYNVRVKSLRLMSNVATPNGGAIKLSECSAPNVAVQALPYVPSQMSDDYNISLQDAPYKIDAGAQHTKSYILWLLPKPAANMPAKKSTHLLANVARLDGNTEATYPKMSTLYVWGSKGNNPRHGKKIHITANIHRPKLAIEYLSDGYVKKTNSTPYTEFVRNTGTTRFKDNSPAAFHTYAGWQTRIPQGYRMLTREERAILLHGSASYKFNSGRKTTESEEITMHGVKRTYKEEYDATGQKVYALRFDDGNDDTKRRQYTAWRYSRNGLMEVVYLGPNFRGDFEDIKSDAFWALHQADIVDRQYGKAESYTNLSKPIAKEESRFLADGAVTFLKRVSATAKKDNVWGLAITKLPQESTYNPPIFGTYSNTVSMTTINGSYGPSSGVIDSSIEDRRSTLFVIQTEIDKEIKNGWKPTFNK